MRRALVPLALLGVLVASGCFEPFRVRVDEDVAGRVPAWTVTIGPVKGDGLGPRSQETRYTLDPEGGGPPFPGTLQVFSVRAPTGLSQDELIGLAKDAVEGGAADHNIRLDPATQEGRRTIESGVRTHWFLRSGTTTGGCAQQPCLFDEQVRIRILGEVGHDGRSNTSFLAVAIVQVERTAQCPLGIACQPERSEASWIQLVGDPDGSVAGATSQSGFIDHLVTR